MDNTHLEPFKMQNLPLVVCEQLKSEGWKNLYLWTDYDCNWEWYIKHGFTLIQEDIYEPFSSKDNDYKTYIFKRKL